VDAFEQHARAGLELAGMQVEDSDLHVMRAVEAVYGPKFRALAEADLRDIAVEPDLDPSRPPTAR
jgi:hypothetical protein